MVTLLGSSMKSSDTRNEGTVESAQKRRFIYFNPNFCINNINVKELVSRAHNSNITTSYSRSCNDVSIKTEVYPSVHIYPPSPNQASVVLSSLEPDPPEANSSRVVLLPTPTGNLSSERSQSCNIITNSTSNVTEKPGPSRQKDFASNINWHDRNHPWFPRHPSYASNLLSLAADYSIRPNQPVRCRLPPLSKGELVFRMETMHRRGKVRKCLRNPTQIDQFIKYMKIVKDQIEFDKLEIDYTNNQTYAECRRKRAMMKRLNVNEYHYINEHVVDDLFTRSQNLKCFKKKIREDLDLSKIDTSRLSGKQRKFLFVHHVLKQGKAKFINEKLNYRKPPSSPKLVSVNKYKAVLKDTVVEAKDQKIRASLRYRRTNFSIHQDCRFYMTTGKCKFGVRCIRKHDPSKLPLKFKKAAATKRPRSAYTVNNLSSSQIKAPSSLQSTSSSSNQTTGISNTTKSFISKASCSGSSRLSSLYKADYRFINNSKLGPCKVSRNRKSVRRALLWKRKTALQKKQDCMFFIRRGKCVFGDTCRKKHDHDKVALCSKFIFSNNCNNENCPYQHKVNSYFKYILVIFWLQSLF